MITRREWTAYNIGVVVGVACVALVAEIFGETKLANALFLASVTGLGALVLATGIKRISI
jgi:uncharacterized membrane protein YuzA (DUF378 family)